MAETENSGVKDLSSTSFGYLIGFVLPGVFGLYAFASWIPQIGIILQPVLKADASVGPSAIFLAVAIGMGVCASALRFWVFEKIVCRKYKFPPDMFASLYKEGKLTAFKAVVDEHYRYHQFYGGCALALPILFVGRIHQGLYQSWWLVAGFLFAESLLCVSAFDSFVKYVNRGRTIVEESKP
jgi:hypothetical protein